MDILFILNNRVNVTVSGPAPDQSRIKPNTNLVYFLQFLCLSRWQLMI